MYFFIEKSLKIKGKLKEVLVDLTKHNLCKGHAWIEFALRCGRSDKSVGDLSRSYKHHNCINGAAADHGEDPELSKEALMNLECGAL